MTARTMQSSLVGSSRRRCGFQRERRMIAEAQKLAREWKTKIKLKA